MYKQFQLDDNFKTHLKGTMQSEHVLRIGTKLTPYQNLFELVSGTESRVVDFTEPNKQLTFFAISLVYDKRDQHISIYGRYNAELVITKIKSITLENTSNTYKTFNSEKFNASNLHNKLLLHN